MSDFSFYHGKKILITGITGFLGNALVQLLVNTDCEIRGLSRQGFPSSSNIQMLQGDISESAVWEMALQEVDIVFHLAAQTSLDFAEKNKETDYRANVLPMARLLETVKKTKKRISVIFSGTSTQAGMPEYLPLDEKHPDRPITIYDTHKLLAENLLKEAAHRGEIFGVSLRLCNIFGPGPNPQGADRGILNRAIRDALSGKSLGWFESHDFVRDYLYISDAARAFLKAGEFATEISGKHFVLGSGKGWKFSSAFEVISEAVTISGGPAVSTHAVPLLKSLHPIHARNVIANSEAFSQLTNWRPEISFQQGILKTVAVYRSHPQFQLAKNL
jgi:UDP-glucose 4-epimerase